MTRSILYYPSINITDGAWLRNAILYWDEVCSIVPERYNQDLSPEISYLREQDYYRPVDPSDLLFSDAYNDFEREIMRKLKRLIRNIENAADHPRRQANLHLQKLYWPQMGEMIHYEKVSMKLYDFMRENNLIRLYQSSDWLEMDVQAAGLYMSTMAEYLAKIDRNDMAISTDKNEYLNSAYPRTWFSQNSFCLTSVFEKAMPAPNLEVPIEKIIDFRKIRSQELIQLRVKLREFENRLSNCESVGEMKAVLEDFRESWGKELIALDKMLKDKRIEYTLKSLQSLIQVSVPSIIPVIREFWQSVPLWLIAAAVGANGAIGLGTNSVSYRSSIREIRNNAGFAYLYDAYRENLIQPRHLIDII